MNVKRNKLIIIENGKLKEIYLDQKQKWIIGRGTEEQEADIKLYSSTISRVHGFFQSMNGTWMYIDRYGKNGTIYNHKYIEKAANGRIRPYLLHDGDQFLFGSRGMEVFNAKTVWGIFLKDDLDYHWDVLDTKGCTHLYIEDHQTKSEIDLHDKGFFYRSMQGALIYIGDLAYVSGNLKLIKE